MKSTDQSDLLILKDVEYVKGLAQVLSQSLHLAAQSQLRPMPCYAMLPLSFLLVTLVRTRCFCLISLDLVAFHIALFYLTEYFLHHNLQKRTSVEPYSTPM